MNDDDMYEITPQGVAYVEYMLTNPDGGRAEYFGAAWDARQSEIGVLTSRVEALTAQNENLREVRGALRAAWETVTRERDEARQALAQLMGSSQ